MDKLYAPWRDCYVENQVKKSDRLEKDCCIFCDVFTQDAIEDEKYILYRDDHAAVMLNLYPYNGGHLLIFPKMHTDQFFKTTEQVSHHLMMLANKSMKILQDVLKCQGVNFGANVGRTAGAGIPDHVHMHVVPRWKGDTGFLSVIGQTKQISVDLQRIYKKLKPIFKKEFSG